MAGRRRPARDERRRTYGQNFLSRSAVVEEFLARAELSPGDHVVELGAGTGALTVPLAASGVCVTAVERDPVWAAQLRGELRRACLDDRVRIVCTDLRRFRFPPPPYRVAANPPFGLTTVVLRRLLDDPARGPERADLLLQREVVVKRAQLPPSTLQSAAWAPWWSFEQGPTVPRHAFRPVPRVDAAWLTVRKRQPALLPSWLAPGFTDTLRAAWHPPQPHG